MKSGINIASFEDNKHRTVTVTTLAPSDLDDLLAYANDLIAEDTFVLLSGSPLTRTYEKTYIEEAMKLMTKDEKIHLVARVDGVLVSSFEVRRLRLRKAHVGEIGISVAKPFRESGIGKHCMHILIAEAKKMGLRMLVLTTFADNARALHLYASVGFRKAGVVPGTLLYKGSYADEVTMYLPLV